MEISVNIIALTDSITKLKALKGDLSGLNKPHFVPHGMDGDVFNNLNQIINLYDEISQVLSEMVDKSIAFLTDAEKQLVASDQAAGNLITQTVTSN